MRAQQAEFFAAGGQKLGLPEPVVIAPGETFRIRSDGPKASSIELLDASRVSPASWFLRAEASGEHVAAEITADSGGHICKNGVGFNLTPSQPLVAGDYVLVLRLDRASWPLVEDDERGSFEGQPAVVRRYRVAP